MLRDGVDEMRRAGIDPEREFTAVVEAENMILRSAGAPVSPLRFIFVMALISSTDAVLAAARPSTTIRNSRRGSITV